MAVKDFHHPFQPYDIQQQFMHAVFDCIEHRRVGIFESPTGTGKSLSLICGSLTWLREHKRKTFDEAMAAVQADDDGEPDWMNDHATEVRKREIRQMRADFEARLAAVRERERRVRERQQVEGPSVKRKKPTQPEDDTGDEEQFVLDEYDSDDASSNPKAEASYSDATAKLMEKLGMLSNKPASNVSEDDSPEELKIFFCSRTHSQLSQFVGELRRVRPPPGLPPDDDEGASDATEHIKHLTLGSRKNLCINAKINKFQSQTAVNERCIELQQANTAAAQKCPYLPNKDSEELVIDFRDHALARIRDIEDLASVGSKLQVCPYYASRSAISPAEIVTLPYPLLLQKSAREALGISLKDHVVIIDEAHNLMDAIEGIYSAGISNTQLQRAKDALIVYLQKFRNRLKGTNRIYVTQLVRVVDSLLQFSSSVKEQKGNDNTITPAVLLAGKAVDQVNLSKLVRYITESKLARKVEGYIGFLSSTAIRQKEAKGRHQDSKRPDEPVDIPTLSHVQNFLLSLTNPTKEGRFVWSNESGEIFLRYLLLDPSEHFREIVQDARAVILAGGTMSPMDDYRQQLFPYLPDLSTFSCGHLVPPSSLFVRTILADDSGRLDYSYKMRNAASATRLGHALLRIAPSVRGGMVVFFPSYGYLEAILQQWKKDDILNKLEKCKAVLFDSRKVPAEETFKTYSQAVDTKGGAILLSVIGGKLSEGINFSDDLGRCVVVVGLPYPNLETPEWKAKMQYLDNRAVQRGEPKGKASREHAENVCMRSVNQAIGRAIRHKNDWASILLFDARYADGRIQSKLPGWIRASYNDRASGQISDVAKDLANFFASRA